MIGSTAMAATTDLLVAAGEALGRRGWAEAEVLYARVLEETEDPGALEGLALACWWQDDVDAAIRARERAYVLRRERGETIEAARVAAFLAWDHGAMRGANAVANGWLQRARRLIAELPPSAEHAWLLLIEASFHLDTDPSTVLRLSTEAVERARTSGGLDVEMTARTLRGLALVSLGRVEEGTRLLDEGTAAATSGELYDPLAIGSCCCNMIIACERSREFDRAGQWCEQLAAFCERTGQKPLLALCQAHHGTVLMMRGDWPAADEALSRAAAALATLRPPLAGYARGRLAQLRLRQGRLREARTLVADDGHVLASLVEAELALEESDAVGAAAGAERHLRALGADRPIESAAALEVLVVAAVALDRPAEAGASHARLAEIAAAVGTDQLRASERCAAGRIALAAGDAGAARAAFEDALDLHARSQAPYEAAVVRVELARALAAADRTGPAADHAVEARVVFERLGAPRAAREADALAARLGRRSAAAERAGLTRREAEVLALAARGLSNREIAEELVVSEHTVHRHLANIYARLQVSSRAAAVARAAEHGPFGR
jgi:DNA-binding NarL/FixJ family response regulator